jgi:hypothetical protein
LFEDLVDLLEQQARRPEGRREVSAHADRLAALSGENKGVNRHVLRLLIPAARNQG